MHHTRYEKPDTQTVGMLVPGDGNGTWTILEYLEGGVWVSRPASRGNPPLSRIWSRTCAWRRTRRSAELCRGAPGRWSAGLGGAEQAAEHIRRLQGFLARRLSYALARCRPSGLLLPRRRRRRRRLPPHAPAPARVLLGGGPVDGRVSWTVIEVCSAGAG